MTDSQERPDPDGYRWKRYILGNTAGEEVVTKLPPEKIAGKWVEEGKAKSKEEIEKVPDSVEPLYSAETIQETIKKVVQEDVEDNDSSAEVIGRLMEVFQDQ